MIFHYAVVILLYVILAAWCAYTLISLAAVRSWRLQTPVCDGEFTPTVTMLKPVKGLDEGAEENFRSFCEQDYPYDRFEVVFGALDPSDPALELAVKLQHEYPHVNIKVVAAPADTRECQNLKVRNLIAMLPQASNEFIVLSDSDMRVAPDYLRSILRPFCNSQANVGLVTCPYQGHRPKSLPSILEALAIGSEFIPGTLVSRMLEGVTFAFGATIVVSAADLQAAGGLDRFANLLADDYQMAQAILSLGKSIVVAPHVVDDVMGGEPLGAIWRRRLRWARTIRVSRPGGYAGSVVTYGTVIALFAPLLVGLHLVSYLTIVVTWLLRITAALIIAQSTGDNAIKRWWILLPLSDLFSAGLFVTCYLGNTVYWRGERYHVHRDGSFTRVVR